VRSLRPTSLGIKAALFYLLLLGAFAATPYSNLFFLLLAFLTILGLLAVVWTHGNLAGATAHLEPVEPGPAGTGAPLRAIVEAGRRLRVAAQVELELENGVRVALSAGLLHGATTVTGRLPALDRGVHRIRRRSLASVWPLGLLRARRPVSGPDEIVVFPAPAVLDESAGGGLGELAGAGADGSMQPSTLREYRTGDDRRRIHWRASARRLSLVVQEWEGGAGAGAEVVLDRRASDERFERALSLLSALALTAQESKEPLTLHTQGLSASFGGAHRPVPELLRFLAEVQPLPADAPPPPAVGPAVPRLPA